MSCVDEQINLGTTGYDVHWYSNNKEHISSLSAVAPEHIEKLSSEFPDFTFMDEVVPGTPECPMGPWKCTTVVITAELKEDFFNPANLTVLSNLRQRLMEIGQSEYESLTGDKSDTGLLMHSTFSNPLGMNEAAIMFYKTHIETAAVIGGTEQFKESILLDMWTPRIELLPKVRNKVEQGDTEQEILRFCQEELFDYNGESVSLELACRLLAETLSTQVIEDKLSLTDAQERYTVLNKYLPNGDKNYQESKVQPEAGSRPRLRC